ncbi:MAG: hypothetical protein K2G99_01335 [Desulfovibrio sp.]|nr:hypothetical protein [Desulfovibrio sp.]
MPIEPSGAGRRGNSTARRRMLAPVFLLGALLALLLTACGPPRPLTFEEQEAYMAKQQCEQEANNIAGPSWGGGNVYWTDYFVMCMNRLGISDAALNRMWY